MRRRDLVWALLLVSLSFGTATGANAQAVSQPSTQAPFQRAVALEHAGRFRAALDELAHARLTPAQAAHRVALRRTVAAFAALAVYHARGELPAQQALLIRLGRQLGPVRDVELRAEQQERLRHVREARAAEADGGIGRWLSDFAADVGGALAGLVTALLSWLALLTLLGAAAWGTLLLVRRRRARSAPQEGVTLKLEDLSATSDERADANRRLGSELQAAIIAATRRAAEGIEEEIDPVRDLDGSGPANVRVAVAGVAPSDSGLTDANVTVGPIGVNLRQLVVAVRELTAPPPASAFGGYLIGDGDTARLAATLRCDGDDAVRGWMCGQDGDRTRAAVIDETAEWILFQLGTDRISDSWPSVCCYRDARRELARSSETADEREVRLKRARHMLERALLHDPTNRLARLELGAVLRKLGHNDEAVAQYELFERLDGDRLPGDVQRIACYSKALALSKLDDWRSHTKARELLEALLHEVDKVGQMSATDRRRWSELARSAWMATKVFELERMRFGGDGERLRRRKERLLAELTAECAAITSAEVPGTGPERTSHVQARAVAENALGRALYLMGRPPRETLPLFESALSGVPELGDAHVNLASALLRARTSTSGWDARIDRHLEHALEISPRDCKALYLRGVAALRVGEPEQARRWFSKSVEQGDRWAQMRLAELAWEDGDWQQAIVLVRRSIARERVVDRRARLLVTWSAALADRGQLDGSGLRAAHRAGQDLKASARRRRVALAPALSAQIALIDAKLGLRSGDADDDGGDDGDF